MKEFTRWDSLYGERNYVLLTESEWSEERGLGNIAFWKLIWNKKSEDFEDLAGIVTDDGYVVPIKSLVSNYGIIKGASTILGTVVFSKHRIHTEYWMEPTERENRKRDNASQNELRFVKELIQTRDEVFAVKTTVGTPTMSDKQAKRKAAALLKKRGVQKAMEKMIKEAADRVGVDYDFVLKRLVELSANDNSIGLNAVKELEEILKMKGSGNKANVNINATLPLSESDIEALEAAKRHKLAEVTEAELVE